MLCALVCMRSNDCVIIIDGETFSKAAVENASNLKGKC